MTFLQATAVSLDDCGILLTGSPGSGKSDLALRLMQEKGALLIGDDGINIVKKNSMVYMSPHAKIKGMLEVRGLGIVSVPYAEAVPLMLHIDLVTHDPERMPENITMQKTIADYPVFSMKINSFHVSSVHKICMALSAVKNKNVLLNE